MCAVSTTPVIVDCDPGRVGGTLLIPNGEPTATVLVTIDVGRFWDLVIGAVAQLD